MLSTPALNGLEWTFDTVASAYEKLRPGYVKALYQALFDYMPIDEHSQVVEVGSGAGQATEPILRTGCQLTAVEYGEEFSKLLRNKFREYPNLSVITGRFEETEFEDDTYALVFSASAFHWVPEEIGYRKVFSMLKSGGTFARFANHPYRDKGNPALSQRINELYEKYYDVFYNKKSGKPTEYSEQQAKDRALIAEKYGFTDIRYNLFYRTRKFSAQEYVALLGTYSDHIAMDDAIRKEFFKEIEKAINQYGGTYMVYDTIDLQLARKP